jgi:hypothetical protein
LAISPPPPLPTLGFYKFHTQSADIAAGRVFNENIGCFPTFIDQAFYRKPFQQCSLYFPGLPYDDYRLWEDVGDSFRLADVTPRWKPFSLLELATKPKDESAE